MGSLGVARAAAAADEAAANGRRSERRAVELRGFAIRADLTTIEVSICDLHYDGCGIETSVPLQKGESMKLSVVGRGVDDVVVCWSRGGRAGLRFVASTTDTREHQPRRDQRTSLSYEVRMRRVGQSNYSVRIFDLSPSGCKVEVVERPRIGEQLMIKFEGLEILQAEVCWTENFVAGLRFERALHPAVFDMLLTRLGGPVAA